MLRCGLEGEAACFTNCVPVALVLVKDTPQHPCTLVVAGETGQSGRETGHCVPGCVITWFRW
jgi:hypothetical protein